MIIMKEIIYKTIGRKGRTTIPFIFRMRLEIADDTLLKFTMDGNMGDRFADEGMRIGNVREKTV